MNEERPPSNRKASNRKSWLERLGSALMGEPKNRDALMEMLRDAQQRELLDTDALNMMEGVMEVSELQVRDVMVPRAQMVIMEQSWDLERLIKEVAESGHSRLPVIGDNKDNVLGILIVKDLLEHAFDRREDFDLLAILRPAKFIPESKRLNALLTEFRSNRLHMAIVVDEYGGVAGLVTIEDVLEEIVGEIDDEHDTAAQEEPILQQDHSFIIKALTPVEAFNKYFQADFSDERADTVGGLIMMDLGRLPKDGEVINLGRFHFRVLRADKRRIDLLEMSISDESQQPPE